MEKYDVVVLAGESKQQGWLTRATYRLSGQTLLDKTNYGYKHSLPMWVDNVEAPIVAHTVAPFGRANRINKIIAVGPVHELERIAFDTSVIFAKQGETPFQSALRGAEKTSTKKALYVCGDLVYLTPEDIDTLIAEVESRDADLVYGLAERRNYKEFLKQQPWRERYLSLQRRYFPVCHDIAFENGRKVDNKVIRVRSANVFFGHPAPMKGEVLEKMYERRKLLSLTSWINMTLDHPDLVARSAKGFIGLTPLSGAYVQEILSEQLGCSFAFAKAPDAFEEDVDTVPEWKAQRMRAKPTGLLKQIT